MKCINFAVVGGGHIGKRHAEIINKNPLAALTAVVDPDSDKTELFRKQGVRVFQDLTACLEAGLDIDVINIAAPNGLHASLAIAALKAGKHVVIEKPMTLSKADAEEIVSLSTQVDRRIFVVMQNRYSPPSVWLKNIVEEGRLGKLYMLQLNCYWNRDQRYYLPGSWRGTQKFDGGVLYTQFSHFIDIMFWLFGDIEHIHSRFYNFNHAGLTEFNDSGLVTFDFCSGGSGVLSFSTAVWDKNLESSITIIGEKGSVRVGGQYMDKVEYCHIRDYVLPELAPTNPGNDYGAFKGSAQNHHLIIENVIDVLNGKSDVTTNALEGMKVVDIIERIYKAG